MGTRMAVVGSRLCLGAGVAIGLLLVNQTAASAWSYGSDSNSYQYAQDGQSETIYIGKIDEATNACYGAATNNSNFRLANANAAGIYNTYSYTFLHGPQGRSAAGGAAYVWGEQQADAAFNCWESGPNASLTQALTIYGDVELNSYCYDNIYCGWNPSPPANTDAWQANIDVISGFTAEMRHDSGTAAGIYTSRTWMDGQIPYQNWAPNSFAWWAYAGCPGYESNLYNSYTTNNSTYESEFVSWQNWNNASPPECQGSGQGIGMWQYCTGCTTHSGYGPSDLDLTPFMNQYECATEFNGVDQCGYYIPTYQ